METREHEMMREKITAVTGLPEGYTPNLASKWELLEVGLKPAEKKRPLFWISAVSAAAVLLFVSTVVLVSMQSEAPAPHTSNVVISPSTGSTIAEKPRQVVAQKAKPAKHRKHTTAPVKPEHKTELIAANPLKDTSETPGETVLPQTAVAVAKKAPRFVEMDFSEPVINNQVPSETVIASQRFKFKLGVGGQSSATTGSSGDRALFRKRFN